MSSEEFRRVRVLVNPKSGLPWSFTALREALERHWDVAGVDLTYQFLQDAKDALAKAAKAVSDGVDTILVAGGDGTINAVGQGLIGTDVSLGVLPSGSGNGFARHFEIPLSPAKAVAALANARVKRIDVGMVNDKPFFVTCSMAWDAALVRSFQKWRIRGVLPYIFAGVNEYLQYTPQEIRVKLDSGEEMRFPDVLVLTVANMTQYGGGAKIAPQAKEDDGYLELILAPKQDVATFLTNVHRMFTGSAHTATGVVTRRFKTMTVKRKQRAEVQIDGDLVDMPAEVKVRVLPKALKVLLPV
jgi:diacylglycerol kinase (ATP)